MGRRRHAEKKFKISVRSKFSFPCTRRVIVKKNYTGLFISPSGISELDCATTKKDMAERTISIGRESLKVFFL